MESSQLFYTLAKEFNESIDITTSGIIINDYLKKCEKKLIKKRDHTIKTIKQIKSLIVDTLTLSESELNKLNILIESTRHLQKFNEVKETLQKENKELLSLTKNSKGLYVIEYKFNEKTYKMLYNNFKYYNCRADRRLVKSYENLLKEQLQRIFGQYNVDEQIKIEGLTYHRDLIIDFRVKINNFDDFLFIECDENDKAHFKNTNKVPYKRDRFKNKFFENHNMKLLRIDPIGSFEETTDEELKSIIDKFINSSDNIKCIGDRY